MALVVPNAGDSTGSSSRYSTLDQSEPDSVDFEVLGNTGRSGVFSGCAVTSNNSNANVTVEAGKIILNGVSYSVAASIVPLPAGPSSSDDPTYRFDLVVARVTNGTVNVVVMQGFADNGGARFPRTRNTAVTYSSVTDIDLTTDVVLASLYRSLSSPVGSSEIVDKRVILSSSIYDVGSADPTGGSTGSLYFKNNRAQGSTGSGVFVKNSLGSWLELGQNIGPQVPVGSIMGWASTSVIPDGWLECNGQSLNREGAYADLFSAIGTTYGSNSGSTFNVPNLNTKFVRGTTSTGDLGNGGGSNTAVVPVPSHRHNHDHSHGMIHYHDVDHGHTASSGNQNANHSHGMGHTHSGNTGNQSANHSHGMGHNHNAATNTAGTHWHGAWFDEVGAAPNDTGHNYHAARPQYWSGIYWKHEGTENDVEGLTRDRITANPYNSTYSGNTSGPNFVDDGNHGHTVSVGNSNANNTGAPNSNHAHGFTTGGATNNNTGGPNANHTHGVTVEGTGNSLLGKRPLANASNTSANKDSTDSLSANARLTDYEGTSGATVDTVPEYVYMRWIIRAKGTVAATISDGNDILSEAREEVVTLELVSSGTSLPSTATQQGYYRLPWAGTLTGVKATLDSGSNTTEDAVVDVRRGGTSIQTATVSSGSDSSGVQALSTAVSNDDLLTIYVSTGSGADNGPLSVTMYFTRDD